MIIEFENRDKRHISPCRHDKLIPRRPHKRLIKLAEITNFYTANPSHPGIVSLIHEVNVHDVCEREAIRLWRTVKEVIVANPERKSLIDAQCTYPVTSFLVQAMVLKIHETNIGAFPSGSGNNHN